MHVPVDRLLSDRFIAARRARLDSTRAADRVEPEEVETASETIYLSAADADGNMVSFINSNYEEFGSGIVVPGTGFVMHDRGAGLTMTEGRASTVAPGRRPLHTLIPAFVTRTERAPDGTEREVPWMSYGVMGGSMQPQGHVQMLLNLLVFDMGLQEAIDAARFRHLAGRRVALESPIDDAVRAGLARMGHEIVDERRVQFGGAQAVRRLAKGWEAGSDPRKDGAAVGW
jgi:gamma-glutamyltranspeptidase/glutathione hydrolase